jgi:D-alanyl-D-alanine carboxypeptidase (penicillin-binding protein 5/6)
MIVHRRLLTTCVVLVCLLICGATTRAVIADRDDAGRHYLTGAGWPSQGQAAYVLGDDQSQASPEQSPAPIASLAKVMTAYLVLRAFPLAPGSDGFILGITADDVRDTQQRRDQDQSVVAVAAGEHLSERQALAALLLPSANNIAAVLGTLIGGSVPAFVAMMNDTAYSLQMRHTTYTDPSGFDAGTRSTAADQLRLARTVMAVPAFADLVGRSSYALPVAGVVHNTDTLLGHDGFAGIKTGSMDAAGGCFMFLSHREVAGQRVDLLGVVLGQPGHNLITAALTSARQLVDRVAPVPV